MASFFRILLLPMLILMAGLILIVFVKVMSLGNCYSYKMPDGIKYSMSSGGSNLPIWTIYTLATDLYVLWLFSFGYLIMIIPYRLSRDRQ